MPKQPSELALQVMEGYNKTNQVEDPEEIGDYIHQEIGNYIHRKSAYNSSIPFICEEEGITIRAVKKCISKGKARVAMRLYILTELERLKNIFGNAVSDEDIDEMISDSLSTLIKNGEFGTLLRETVL